MEYFIQSWAGLCVDIEAKVCFFFLSITRMVVEGIQIYIEISPQFNLLIINVERIEDKTAKTVGHFFLSLEFFSLSILPSYVSIHSLIICSLSSVAGNEASASSEASARSEKA